MDRTMKPPRPVTRTLPLALAALCGVLAAPLAQANVYLCTNAAGGRELTDSYKPGCKQLDVPGTIAAPARRTGGGGGTRVAAPVSTPTDFPKVDNAQQRARDNDRREILNDELRSEEGKLAQLKSEYKNGTPDRSESERNIAKYQERVTNMRDNIARAEKNVEALKREIANIR
jgi:chromosome segregation ATPase